MILAVVQIEGLDQTSNQAAEPREDLVLARNRVLAEVPTSGLAQMPVLVEEPKEVLGLVPILGPVEGRRGD